MEYETRGIILNRQEINEFDEIVSVLSERGRINIFAPGVRKAASKNNLNLQLYSLVDLEIITSKRSNLMPRLKRATLIKQIPINIMLKQEYDDIKYFFSKITSTKTKLIIDEYSEYIEYLAEEKNKTISYLLYKLMIIEGIAPRFDGCVECGRKDRLVDFEFHRGGFLCTFHSSNNKPLSLLNSLFWLNSTYISFADSCSPYDGSIIRKMIIQYLIEVL
ncbi:DNA repair protein RecO [Mycoplasma phocoeninasale]|uniref:DNA repair protein RecO n=1 Tax=Mycoplasma phocoeninasale TaxID=2726117 RepID=A0A858U1E4_9MOLU|nr:DNA repair protein RecO [Mycoplasma phocoeninasale]MBN0970614.1 DNA repair protein RecO [Mycoplasma phocoeninasale]QJG66270.1 DNA repair protein RecO [Mycoplasma phocoeninasale]